VPHGRKQDNKRENPLDERKEHENDPDYPRNDNRHLLQHYNPVHKPLSLPCRREKLGSMP
jgi:hypothetical protein